MPLTADAANRSLQWVDYVGTVALYKPNGGGGLGLLEVSGGSYARQPVTFSPIIDGARYSNEVLLFEIPNNTTVAWYALLDGADNVLARMPNYTGNVPNQPSLCFFLEDELGWINAPEHGMTVGQQVIFLSGQHPRTNTDLTSTHDLLNPLGGDLITYNTLPPAIWQVYGPMWLWTVAEIEQHRFRIIIYADAPEVYVPSYAGWGYFQRIDQSVFDGGGTLRIDSIRVAEFG